MKKIEIQDDSRCFVCGMDNLEGLRIVWRIEEKTTTAEFVPDAKYQGWQGIVHGGILATLLDEAMARLAGVLFGKAVTAEMTVRYLLPVPVGQLLWIKGEVLKESRKILEMRSELRALSPEGTLMAHATGKIMKI